MTYDDWKATEIAYWFGSDADDELDKLDDLNWPEDTLEYMIFLDRVEGSEPSLIKGPPSWRVSTTCPECLGTGVLKTDGITMCTRCPGTGTIHILKEN